MTCGRRIFNSTMLEEALAIRISKPVKHLGIRRSLTPVSRVGLHPNPQALAAQSIGQSPLLTFCAQRQALLLAYPTTFLPPDRFFFHFTLNICRQSQCMQTSFLRLRRNSIVSQKSVVSFSGLRPTDLPPGALLLGPTGGTARELRPRPSARSFASGPHWGQGPRPVFFPSHFK